MTDETAAPEVKERSIARRVLVIALLVIAAIILVGFLASRSGLDKALLRQRLDAFAADLAAKGVKDGRDVQFTYRDIEITGNFSNRHAVILSPQLSIKPLDGQAANAPAGDDLIVRTDEVAIYPKAVDLSEVTVRLAKPIEFLDAADASRKLLTISSAEPFDAEVERHTRDARDYLTVTHTMPTSIDLTYLREKQAEGQEDATPTIVPVYETLTLTQAAGGIIRTDMAEDESGLGEAQVKLSDLVLTPEVEPEGAIRIATISSDWKHSLNEKNHHVVDVKMQVGDITAAPEMLPYAPLALVLDATYEGAAPQTAQDLAAIRAQESSIKLNRFALTTKEAQLTATADFVASATDILPVGMANIAITNVPYVLAELRKFGLVNPGNEPLIADIATLVTGTPYTEITDATIEINRVRGGSFAIGKATFEELFATVLKNSMQRRMNSVPVDPVEQKDVPAITTEEGLRG